MLVALKAVWAVWVYRLGKWTRAASVSNAVLGLVTAAVMIYLLASGNFFNPAFTGFIDADADLERWVSLATILGVALSTFWDIFDIGRKVEQSRKGLPAKVPGTGNTYNYN